MGGLHKVFTRIEEILGKKKDCHVFKKIRCTNTDVRIEHVMGKNELDAFAFAPGFIPPQVFL